MPTGISCGVPSPGTQNVTDSFSYRRETSVSVCPTTCVLFRGFRRILWGWPNRSIAVLRVRPRTAAAANVARSDESCSAGERSVANRVSSTAEMSESETSSEGARVEQAEALTQQTRAIGAAVRRIFRMGRLTLTSSGAPPAAVRRTCRRIRARPFSRQIKRKSVGTGSTPARANCAAARLDVKRMSYAEAHHLAVVPQPARRIAFQAAGGMGS